MLYEGKIWLGTGEHPVCLLPQMANRHGLIAGATGTGKTVSLKVLAEGFSDMGVPVFLADIKGDLAGMVQPGTHSDNIANRLTQCGVPTFEYRTFPTVFWDVFGKEGHPVRTTVSEMGPTLLARLMNLNDTQAGVLSILFRVADDENMLLLDLKDLKAMLAYIGEHAKEYTLDYGNVSMASVGAIQRAVAMLEDEGGNAFFGEPALNIADWMQLDESGRGVINILAADVLYRKPRLYSTFLLWMLSELFEILPEAGDLDKPRMVFFFDEAHMLFRDAPTVLLQKVEQTVKLIRSRGVGVYFVTQSPSGMPDTVLAQLSNRVQHALRAYTPAELKAVRAAARAFRPNPAFQAEDAIMELGVGEALTSFLDEGGVPAMVQRTKIICPQSLMAAPEPMARAKVLMRDGMEKYDDYVDNLSAYEVLTEEAEKAETAKQEEADRKAREKAEAEAEKKRLKEEEADKKRQLEDEARKRQQKLYDEARRRQQKLEDEERRKAERQQEKAEAEAKRKAERRAAKIETQLISAGGQILKRGLLGVLKKR